MSSRPGAFKPSKQTKLPAFQQGVNKILNSPPDIAAWRNRLFNPLDIVDLPIGTFRVYWPWVSNVWALHEDRTRERKAEDGSKSGLFDGYVTYRCRLYRKTWMPKEEVKSTNKRQRTPREGAQCQCQMKVIYSGDTVTLERFGKVQEPHTHSLDRIDQVKLNDSLRLIVLDQVASGHSPTVIVSAIKGVGLYEDAQKQYYDAGARYLNVKHVHNWKREFAKADPDTRQIMDITSNVDITSDVDITSNVVITELDITSNEVEIDEIFLRLRDAFAVYSSNSNRSIGSAKMQVRKAALELASALQSPQEAGSIFAMSSAVHACYRAAGDCGILSAWEKETMSAEDLAEKTGAEARLVVRLMRALTADGIFCEKGEELYAHNERSKTLSVGPWLGMVRYMTPGTVSLPQYLACTSYKNPGSDSEAASLFQYANNTPLSFYQALAKDEKARSGFDYQMKQNILMERAKSQKGFASIYDFEGELGPLLQCDDDVALVDVGGSGGHVVEDVKKHLPGLRGRLVLEEPAETLRSVKVPEGIEAVAYNFLESVQPIKGAACYLFRQIFLNWPDAAASTILRNTLPALKTGHSRILIMEMVPPPVCAPLQVALVDIQMAQMGGGLRSEKQWRALLQEAGFEITKLLRPKSAYTIIEAVPIVSFEARNL